MNKIVILACVLIVLGFGCAPKQNLKNDQALPQEKTIQTNLSASEIQDLKNIHNEKAVGFDYKFFSPAYIPNKLELKKESFNTEENEEIGKTITYLYGAEINSTDDWIFVRQQIDKRTNEEKKLNSRMTPITDLDGYTLVSETANGKFNNLVFSKNKILVSIMSNNISLDELIKMAKSMANL